MWAKAMFWGNKAQALHELQVHQIELEMQNADLRQAQKEMDAERTRYLDLYDHSPVGYCTLDPQGLILETNLTATTLLGETKDELVKQSLSRFINKEDLELFHGNRKQLFDNDEPQAYELRMVRKGGVDFWASLETTVAQDAEGKPVCRVVLSDITQRKKAEAELVKMQNLQSVGTLAGVIAHDFNNILMGLFGNIALAKDELPKDHPGFALLEEAEKSMSRAVRLTKQLLTFSKGGSPVKEDINLAALAEEVALFDLSGSQVKLVFHPSKDLWLVEADKGQIQQVVSNLSI
jgi:PAS domain S-box-containing protein